MTGAVPFNQGHVVAVVAFISHIWMSSTGAHTAESEHRVTGAVSTEKALFGNSLWRLSNYLLTQIKPFTRMT